VGPPQRNGLPEHRGPISAIFHTKYGRLGKIHNCGHFLLLKYGHPHYIHRSYPWPRCNIQYILYVADTATAILVLDLVSQVRDVVLVMCIFSSGKPQGIGILERRVYGEGDGNGEISL
jgi:hypothetical protein